jgi:phage terminase large subunit-like protein
VWTRKGLAVPRWRQPALESPAVEKRSEQGLGRDAAADRKWLKFCGPNDKPERFDQIIQSWDTANKDNELSNYSVCVTWGVKRQHLYLLDVYRRKHDFPSLKRAVSLAKLHKAKLVLVEDKASGDTIDPS